MLPFAGFGMPIHMRDKILTQPYVARGYWVSPYGEFFSLEGKGCFYRFWAYFYFSQWCWQIKAGGKSRILCFPHWTKGFGEIWGYPHQGGGKQIIFGGGTGGPLLGKKWGMGFPPIWGGEFLWGPKFCRLFIFLRSTRHFTQGVLQTNKQPWLLREQNNFILDHSATHQILFEHRPSKPRWLLIKCHGKN